MKKILIAALATSFALGVSNSYASETPAVENDVAVAAPAQASQNDKDIVIYEIESSAPDNGNDYIVLYNKGTKPVNLKGWSFIDNGKKSTKAVIGDVSLEPGQTLKLEQNKDFTFGLGSDDGVHLYNASADLIHEHNWANHAEGILKLDLATGLFNDIADPSLPNEAPVETPAPEENPTKPADENQTSSNIVINEVESDDDKVADYVELYNKGNEPVSLDGWYLLDEKDDREIVKLSGVSLNPGEFFVLENGVHFKFGLGNGDTVRIYDHNNKLVDKFEYTSHAFGVYSRYPDGTGEFVDAQPSKGKPNTKAVDRTIEEAESSKIIINEIQQDGENDAPDYVELKNISDKDVTLTGWYILDDTLTRTPEPIGEGVVIPAGGYFVLENGVHFSFGLGKNDEVNLFNPKGELADRYAWQGHVTGKVYARNDETGEFEVTNPTKGRANNSKTNEELAAEKPVVINEVESSPIGGGKDYAEIYNRSNKPVDISGWYILDNKAGVDKVTKVKDGTILKPGAFYAFEEGVDFEFGLGSNDEVNLYDKDGSLVDKFSWTSHATGTLGRYPDGFGGFVDGAPTKGRANVLADDPTAGIEDNNWPGLEDITILDETPIFDLKDLSGLDNHEGWLYGVNNKEGRFFVFKVVDGKVEFAPGFDAKGKAVNFKTDANDPTKLGPDSEGITVDSKGRVYIAVERDNNNKNENYNVILQVADPFKDQKVMVADKQWNITSLLPAVGANLGIETIEWVPFKNLNGLLYDQSKNKAFDANDYKDAYADGVFFVGMEANGHIYALILKEDETAQLIADIDSGLGGVMGMDYDLSNNVLWAQTDDGYNNIHTVIQFNGTNNPKKVHMSAPAGMDPKLNNEGFVIDPSVDKDGNRNTYWFMDGTNEGAFRNGKLKADYMKDLGLTTIPGKEITSPEKPVVDEKLEALRKAYKTVIEVMPNLYTSEKADLKAKLDSAKTEKDLIEIYAQAQVLNSSRVKVPAPSIEKPAPSTPNTVYLPSPVYVPVPSVKSDKIYVSKERKYVKEGFYTRSELESLREKLVKAKKDNQVTVRAAKLLLELTPNTVSKSKTKLLNLIVKAEKLQIQAQAAIDEIDDILK